MIIKLIKIVDDEIAIPTSFVGQTSFTSQLWRGDGIIDP